MTTSFLEVVCYLKWALFLSTRDQVNASPITKITTWFKFLGKNLHLLGCATVCAKSEVMLFYIMTIVKTFNLKVTAIFNATTEKVLAPLCSSTIGPSDPCYFSQKAVSEKIWQHSYIRQQITLIEFSVLLEVIK